MIVPSKFTTIDESILCKSIGILKSLKQSKYVTEAYRNPQNPVHNLDEFILGIDLLWLMDKIDVSLEDGEITNVK